MSESSVGVDASGAPTRLRRAGAPGRVPIAVTAAGPATARAEALEATETDSGEPSEERCTGVNAPLDNAMEARTGRSNRGVGCGTIEAAADPAATSCPAVNRANACCTGEAPATGKSSSVPATSGRAKAPPRPARLNDRAGREARPTEACGSEGGRPDTVSEPVAAAIRAGTKRATEPSTGRTAEPLRGTTARGRPGTASGRIEGLATSGEAARTKAQEAPSNRAIGRTERAGAATARDIAFALAGAGRSASDWTTVGATKRPPTRAVTP